jgi:hypothetical protein
VDLENRLPRLTSDVPPSAGWHQDLKSQPRGDIGVHASFSVTQALLAANVVDELRLVIAPRIVESGNDCSKGCRRSSSNRFVRV